MEIIFVLTAILQSVGVSLGVGSSTLAITNFFVAISDGKIDETERNMMGIVYIILRIAMIIILVTTTILTLATYGMNNLDNLSPYVLSFWILILVLFSNAALMTAHKMPSTVGPALQASTWYTMGVLIALIPLGLADFSFTHFLLAYVAVILLAVSLVNGIMAALKHSKHTSK